MEDYYKLLGIERNASPEQIKKAYRMMAKKYHPDSGTGHEETFKKISGAYEILIDPVKKTDYDRKLTEKEIWGSSYGKRTSRTSYWEYDPWDDWQKMWNDFFGSGYGRARRQPKKKGPQDIHATAKVTPDEAAKGCTKKVHVRYKDTVNGSWLNDYWVSRSFQVKIPPRTPDGTLIRLKGVGKPTEIGGSGNVIVRVRYKYV